MRLIDTDELDKIKYHPIPYTHIVPSDVDAESYKRGWNDAIDSVICYTSTIEERKTGRWIVLNECANAGVYCSECHKKVFKEDFSNTMKWKNFAYCPNCGVKMEGNR